MAEEPKSTSGLFRLKDLESISLDQEPLFPTRNDPPPSKAPGVVSEGAAEEMVAAIRRARTQAESTTTREPSDAHRLDELIGLARAAQATPEPEEAAHEPTRPPQSGKQSVTLFPTGETRAVLEKAEADMLRRKRRTTLLAVGIPLLVVIATATAVLVLLLSRPPYGNETYRTTSLQAAAVVSPRAEVGLLLIPEPPPEPEPVPEPEPPRERRRDRDQERRDSIDRGSLF